MNPSYFRIKLSMEEAVRRACEWYGRVYRERIETNYSKAVDASLDQNKQWKGSCLYAYEKEGWTVFEDLSGGCSCNDVEQWLEFAKQDEFIFAGYNDAILYGEMVVITDGIVSKHFMEDFDMPEENVNEGDGVENINSWIDVAKFVDEDAYLFSDEGVVFIF